LDSTRPVPSAGSWYRRLSSAQYSQRETHSDERPPGSGKSTLANEIARDLGIPVIDKDAIRDVLPDDVGGRSYEAMLALAQRQLRIGLSVVADSPLGYGRAYRAAINLAAAEGAGVAVIECHCSNVAAWRERVEARQGTGLPDHHTTNWASVAAFGRRTKADPFDLDVPHLRIDTAASMRTVLAQALRWLKQLDAESPS
jgi:predicted kinase